MDAEPEVRSLAALVLGASNGERARVLLLEALTDRDPKVRDAAAQSLSRILGKDVSPVVELDDPQRRRAVRRLATLPVATDGGSRALVKSYFNFATQENQDGAGMAGVRAEEQAAVAAPPSAEQLCTAVMSDVRGALRGCSLAELAASSRCAPDLVQEACELLVARGQVVRRGLKYFAA